MLRREFLEHFDRRRRRARRAGALQHGQLHALEQHFRELLRRTDIELAAGRFENAAAQVAHLAVEDDGLPGQRADVDPHADPLDRGEDRHQRQLEVAIHRFEFVLDQDRLHLLGKLHRDVRALTGVIEHAVDRYLRKRHRLDALAAHFFFGQRLVAKLLQGQRLECLARTVRVHEVTGDHRVEAVRIDDVDTVAPEHDQVSLEVVADLFDGRIGEQRPENRQRFGLRHQYAAAESFMAERHVARLPARDRDRDADQRCAHRRGAVGDHLHAEAARGLHLSRQRLQFVRRADQRVVLLHGCGGRRVLRDQRAELHLREQLVAAFAIGALEAELLDLERHAEIGADRHQLAALPRLVRVCQEAFTLTLVLDLRGMLQERFERSIGVDQVGCALFPDAGYALHVVDRIAHQREHIAHLRRFDAPLLLHTFRVVPSALVFRVVDANAVLHELEEILVAGHDRGLKPVGTGLHRQRADHVVSFHAFERQDGHAHGLARFVDPRHLFGEVAGHGSPIGLVVGGDVRAEGLPAQVERREDVLRLMVREQLAEHRDEAVGGVGGLAVRPGQAADRVIRAIHLVTAVDEEKRGAGGHQTDIIR